MKTHTIEFRNEDEDTVTFMTIGAGDTELNEYFRAASMNFIAPHALAMKIGKLPEEREREILLRAYACGVVLETDPKMSEEEVFEWFQGHPKEFDILFEFADHRENFEEDGDSDEHGRDAAASGAGDEGAD